MATRDHMNGKTNWAHFFTHTSFGHYLRGIPKRVPHENRIWHKVRKWNNFHGRGFIGVFGLKNAKIVWGRNEIRIKLLKSNLNLE